MGFTRSYRLYKSRGVVRNTVAGGEVPTAYKGDSIKYVTACQNSSSAGFNNIARSTKQFISTPSARQMALVCIGQGTTPSTMDDYTLDQPYTENNCAMEHLYDEQTLTYSADTQTNQLVTKVAILIPEGQEAITIKEIGLIVNNFFGSGISSSATYQMTFYTKSPSNYEPILIYREVLPENQWITINPGEVKEITVTIPNIDAYYNS